MILIILLTLFLGYIIYYYFFEFKDRQNSPPGPLPLPLIGNLHHLAAASNVSSLAIAKIGEKYGEIFRIKIGSKVLLIPTTIEAIQTLFSQDDISGRDLCGTLFDRNMGQNLGMVFSDGPIHAKTKAWTMRSLRDHGLKSSSMEISIKNELEILLKEIEGSIISNKGIMQINHAFIVPVFNVAWRMITGHNSKDDDVFIKQLLLKSEVMLATGIFGAGLINAFPFLRFLIPEFTGHNAQMAFYKDCHQTARELLKASKEVMKNKTTKTADNLIEAFVLKMEEEEKDHNTIFTEDNFVVVFMDLLQASSDTTNAFLECLMLYTVLHPDVMEKVYEEIQQCIPDTEEVNFEDRKRMIYTQAFFLETHRHAKIVQNFVPRTTFSDITYKGYLIKKGTVMMADLTTAYKCPKTWKDSEAFLPERFINENGELCNQDRICPFSLGKRFCPGENLAIATYFLMYVMVIRKYKVTRIPRQNPPRADLSVGMTSKPYPFDAVFTRRV